VSVDAALNSPLNSLLQTINWTFCEH
jgi:hypothetical protein